jgi:hypothetical protein
MKWIINNKTGLILGFIFGAVITPSLAVFGLISSFIEILRPLLIGPMDFVGNFIPNIQTAPNTFYIPVYKWILTLGANGICYALIGGIIQSIIQSLKEKS